MPAKFRRFVTRTALQANCLCGQTFGKLRPDFRVIGKDIAAASWICVAYRGSESFRCTFSANSDSDSNFLATICYTLPSYGCKCSGEIGEIGTIMRAVCSRLRKLAAPNNRKIRPISSEHL